MKPLILAATALAATALAAILASDAALAEQAQYRCRDGSRVSARFETDADGKGSVALAFGAGRPVLLPQVLSADGGRYASGNIEFWIKGRGARLTRAGKVTNCTTK